MQDDAIFEMMSVEEAAARIGSGPVAAAPYHDPAWWELEREAIFMRTWLHVGHVCEVPEPGSFVRRDIEFADASLLIMRGRDGEVRAFHNVCRHRGSRLVEEASGRRATFSCRYHMWTYGSDGRLVSAPDFERFHVGRERCGLKPVATEVLAGMIFVNFASEPEQSAREFFGPLAGAMEELPVARATHFTEWTYEIAANWKTNFDNFQENYHLRFIHPRTGEQAIGRENPFGYPTHYGFLGPHRSQQLWKNPERGPVPEAIALGYRKAGALAQAHGLSFPKRDFKLFPCFHIVALPPYQQYTHTMFPLGPDRTRGQVRMYWTGAAKGAWDAFTREFGAMVVRDVLSEDRHAVEASQKGIAALDEVFFQDHEVLLRHLYNEVQARVKAFVKSGRGTEFAA